MRMVHCMSISVHLEVLWCYGSVNCFLKHRLGWSNRLNPTE